MILETGFPPLQMLLKYPVNDQAGSDADERDQPIQGESGFYYEYCLRLPPLRENRCVEGVETDDELTIVRQTDCDMIQGFYFYKPSNWSGFMRC